MPWCERCDRFLNPNTVGSDGTCPSCGREIQPPSTISPSAPGTTSTVADDEVKAPWHFWLMIAGVVIYLGWRLIEGIVWLVRSWF